MSLAEVFSYEAFVHAISGTAGGACAMTLFYPLDVMRTHMQVCVVMVRDTHGPFRFTREQLRNSSRMKALTLCTVV